MSDVGYLRWLEFSKKVMSGEFPVPKIAPNEGMTATEVAISESRATVMGEAARVLAMIHKMAHVDDGVMMDACRAARTLGLPITERGDPTGGPEGAPELCELARVMLRDIQRAHCDCRAKGLDRWEKE